MRWAPLALIVAALFVASSTSTFADPPQPPRGRAVGNKHVGNKDVRDHDSKPVSVPEPTTLTLLALGAGAVAAGGVWRARRKGASDRA